MIQPNGGPFECRVLIGAACADQGERRVAVGATATKRSLRKHHTALGCNERRRLAVPFWTISESSTEKNLFGHRIENISKYVPLA